MNDPLGDRIKHQYESRTRYYLPRRTFTILRLDGCHFHTYTRGLQKPFDKDLFEDIDNAIITMLPEIQGSVFAYTQSDEISILLTDFATPQTDAWFDGNIQKMSSVAASIMTAKFNFFRIGRMLNNGGHTIHQDLACFDCRAFTIPDRTEVMNYFRWRQQDCVRNSVSMVAQANFSHMELHGKSQSDMHEMLHQKGVNWATDFSEGEKNGRIIMKECYDVSVDEINKHLPDDEKIIGLEKDGLAHDIVKRTRWTSKGAWVFTKDEGKLLNMIPDYE